MRLSETRGRWVLAATVLGSGLAMLDATVVNIALDRISHDLGASFAGLQWTVNAYTLSLAALILLGGSLGDRFGRRRMFLFGTVWFALASLLCGTVSSIGLLIAARTLQGIGGALLTPSSLAIISASFAHEERAKAVGAWSGLSGIAGAVGPFVGGWLVEISWRTVFLVNLPVAIAIVLITVRHVPESRDPQASPSLDVPGTLLGAVGLAGTTYALIMAGASGLTAATVVAGVVGVLALVAFVARERRARNPLIPLELFRNPQFTAANLSTLLVYGALGAMIFLLVLQLQVVARFSPFVAGAALLPVTVLMLLFSARSGALAQRIGPRPQMTVGPLVCALGLLLLLRVGAGASYLLDVLPAVFVFGLGLATTVAPLTATVLGSAEDRHAGVASGVNNAIARAAGLLSVATIPVVTGLSGNVTSDPVAFGAGFRQAMLLCAGLLAVGALVSFTLIRNPLATAPPGAPAGVPAAAGTPPAAAQFGDTGHVHVEQQVHCAISGPALCPRERSGD